MLLPRAPGRGGSSSSGDIPPHWPRRPRYLDAAAPMAQMPNNLVDSENHPGRDERIDQDREVHKHRLPVNRVALGEICPDLKAEGRDSNGGCDVAGGPADVALIGTSAARRNPPARVTFPHAGPDDAHRRRSSASPWRRRPDCRAGRSCRQRECRGRTPRCIERVPVARASRSSPRRPRVGLLTRSSAIRGTRPIHRVQR
jgi:hypothetical protein